MKIVICGSMSKSKEMVGLKNILENNGHDVILPRNTELYACGKKKMEDHKESTENKIKDDLIRTYFEKIKDADAVLGANYSKNGVDNYIGGNSFLELSFGYILKKRVYLLNPIPEMIYSDELKALQPIILDGDLSKIDRDLASTDSFTVTSNQFETA